MFKFTKAEMIAEFVRQCENDEGYASVVGYDLWDGEQRLYAHFSTGAHGFASAAIVVHYCDDPIKVESFNGYSVANRKVSIDEREDVAFTWLFEKIKEYAHGTGLAEGTSCVVRPAGCM